jgi:hypothetical protein
MGKNRSLLISIGIYLRYLDEEMRCLYLLIIRMISQPGFCVVLLNLVVNIYFANRQYMMTTFVVILFLFPLQRLFILFGFCHLFMRKNYALAVTKNDAHSGPNFLSTICFASQAFGLEIGSFLLHNSCNI